MYFLVLDEYIYNRKKVVLMNGQRKIGYNFILTLVIIEIYVNIPEMSHGAFAKIKFGSNKKI